MGKIMLEDLLKRMYSSDPETHQGALAEILSDPGSALITLLELLARVGDSGQPTAPLSPEEIQAQLAALELHGDESLDELVTMVSRVQLFQNSFRQQSEVMLDLRRAAASLGRPAWAEMMGLARSGPKHYLDPIHYLMLDLEDAATVDDLLAVLEHEQVRLRQRAAYMLAKHDDLRVVPVLAALLNNDDGSSINYPFDTREVAARALAECGRPGADTLLEVFNAGDLEIRDFVIVGLMQTGDPRALDAALSWLLAPDARQRLAGLHGIDRMLGTLPPDHMPRVLEALIQRIRQGDENSFSPASAVIAKLGEMVVEPMLALVGDRALDSVNETARAYALDALWHIYRTTPASIGVRFPELVGRLVGENRNPTLAAFAAQILAELPGAQSVDALLAALQTHRESRPTLTSIVFALGQQGDPRALPPLRNLLAHWQNQPRNFENFELVDEINGAVDRIEMSNLGRS
jgi:HEAT repeat protein